MAKAKKKAAPRPRAKKEVVIDEAALDDGFLSSCEAVAGRNGWKDDSIVGIEARKLFVGLPLPSFALEMLLMCSCWPLGRVFQLVGEEGCGKSTFLYEIIRWVLICGGFAHILENENKDNAAVREAVLQYNRVWLERRLRIDWTGSMDDWIKRLRRNIQSITKLNEGLPDDGAATKLKRFHWRCPYIYVVDSLMGTGTDKRRENINKAGAPTQDFAREAGMLADEVRTWPATLRKTSILLGGTNHMKPSHDRHGNKVPASPGGKSIKFQEVLEIHMDRYPSDLNKVDRGGYTVSLFTHKNSFGPDKRRISVNMLWEKEETDDPLHPRKKMYWDWHSATTRALLEYCAQGASFKKAVDAVVDLNPVKGHKVWSEALGIPEDAPADHHTVGRMIDTDMDLRKRLRAAIGIEPMNHFRPGVPLREIYDRASFAENDALESVYVATDTDLSDFADVTAALAGHAAEDRRRVAKQKSAEKKAKPESFDDIVKGFGPDE